MLWMYFGTCGYTGDYCGQIINSINCPPMWFKDYINWYMEYIQMIDNKNKYVLFYKLICITL